MEECLHSTFIERGKWDGKILETGERIYGSIVVCAACGQEMLPLAERFSSLDPGEGRVLGEYRFQDTS